MLISDGEVTVPGLFVNNSMGLNRRIGLVGYWGVVAFDEFLGKRGASTYPSKIVPER